MDAVGVAEGAGLLDDDRLLSACETATGDSEQPDQAVHLAAAMLFVGFRSVIATMW